MKCVPRSWTTVITIIWIAAGEMKIISHFTNRTYGSLRTRRLVCEGRESQAELVLS